MKQLREQLVLKGAEVVTLNQTKLADGGVTLVLKVKGPMTKELADVLRCRNQVYNLNDNPYPSLKSLTLEHEISSCEMQCLGLKLKPSMVTGFTVEPKTTAGAEGEMELHFRLKFSDYADELNSMFSEADDAFDLAIVALQANLFDAAPSGKDEGEGEAGGTKVDMSPKKGPEPVAPKPNAKKDAEAAAAKS